MPDKPITRIRQEILDRAGLAPEPYTRRMVRTSSAPDQFRKTDRMKLVEREVGVKLEDELFNGTLSKVASRLGVHRTTVSKWRRYALRLGFNPGVKSAAVI